MKTSIAALAVVAALSLAFESRAQAQHVIQSGAWAGTPMVAGTTSGFISYSSSYVAPYSVAPYSYYVAYPLPARTYVEYGANDFPFYGQPYGSPNDRWSWAAMSTNPLGPLARYYYPPVR